MDHIFSLAHNNHKLSSQQILEIQAIDKDTGNNARITYKIAADPNSTEDYFKVQPSTGWVYLAKQLDRETTAKHKMVIIAVDNGIPPLSATANLVVNVIDANDNDPVFSKAAYEFQVEENQKAGAVVGKIAATDADLGDNAVIKYSLFPSNTSFIVNPVTGEFLINYSAVWFLYYFYIERSKASLKALITEYEVVKETLSFKNITSVYDKHTLMF